MNGKWIVLWDTENTGVSLAQLQAWKVQKIENGRQHCCKIV